MKKRLTLWIVLCFLLCACGELAQEECMHDWVPVEGSASPMNCFMGTDGMVEYACSLCSETTSETIALDHEPPAFDCTEGASCSTCGAVMEPGEHSPSGDATCEAASVCIMCGAELAPMLEHD